MLIVEEKLIFYSNALFRPGIIKSREKRIVILPNKSSLTSNRCGDVVISFENGTLDLKMN